MILWTRRMQFWQRRREFFENRPKVCRSRSENDEKLFLPTKKFSLRISYGPVDCSFDNTAVMLSTQARKKSINVPRDMYNAVLTTTPNFKLTKCQNSSTQRPKMKNNIIFSNGEYFSSKCSHGHIESSCHSRPIDFWQNAKNVFAYYLKMLTIIFFSQTKYFSWKQSYWHIKCGFNNRAKSVTANGQKTFHQCPKMIQTSEDFSKKKFSSRYSYGHLNCSFHNLAHEFSTKIRKKAPLKVRWWQKFLYIPKNSSFRQNAPMDI